MEKIYNGIELPEIWPPRDINLMSKEPIKIPYLAPGAKPEIIDIRIGRQLFVDDFLIAETDLKTVYHKPVKYEGNPIFRPETPLECEQSLPCACPKSGGVWYDEFQKKYRMWYEAGWLNRLAYAESDDGLTWTRPVLDIVEGTNEILPDVPADSSTVFIDYDTTDENQRYKLFMRVPGGPKPGYAYVSADGIHWGEATLTDKVEDRSTVFYNPFRKKWVYSIRRCIKENGVGRIRDYRECDDYLTGAKWESDEGARVAWLRVDNHDTPDPEICVNPQLYNFDAVAYESIMLGMFQIHRGPDNKVCGEYGIPKITELEAAYSRDGFHFSRPDREAFIPASRSRGIWDRGYVQSVGGICTVHGDELWFYYIGFEGDEGRNEPKGKLNGMHDKSSTGIAKLRRDGFASLEGSGELLTECLSTGEDREYLFINADAEHGSVRAEILDADGNVLRAMDNCTAFSADSTKAMLKWSDGEDCKIKGKPFRIRFALKEASLYSFWLAKDKTGESNGFLAGGEKQ